MQTNFINIPPKYHSLIKKTVNDFVKVYKLNPNCTLNIEFVSSSRIKSLNKKYRQVDKPTDVLSFPIWQDAKNMPGKGSIGLGDIFICPEMTDIDQELANLISHSLNHLVGKHH